MTITTRGTELTSLDVAWRDLKIKVHQGRRLARWSLSSHSLRTGVRGLDHELLRIAIPIRRDDADPVLEDGKRRNLALAAPAFDGLVLSPDTPFSFWRTLGRVTREAGFVDGRELRAGCIVPALGGGLCLLSNGLFELAARLGWDVLERHGHTAAWGPQDQAVWGLDATLFWPHVDLRFAPRVGSARLSVQVRRDALIVAAHGSTPLPYTVGLRGADDRTTRVGDEWVRTNTLLRTLTWPSHLEHQVLGHNRKRLVDAVAEHRTCRTCGEDACALRPS